MPHVALKLDRRQLRPHRASIAPDFGAPTVLADEPWNFVSMWLRRRSHAKARYFWDQAHHFFDAAVRLPVISAPLPAYYSFLNATKCLLLVKKASSSETHGVGGAAIGTRMSLEKEAITLQQGGVLAALTSYLGLAPSKRTITLKAALYNLPYVHRAFRLTFASTPELYLPVIAPRFVRKSGSEESWIEATVPAIYSTEQTLARLPRGCEQDVGYDDDCVIRMRKRFRWKRGVPRSDNLRRLVTYHHDVRHDMQYITAPTRLWYLKRSSTLSLRLELPPLTLAIAAMHRLSELARYSPDLFAKHFDSKHNWLLSEFIKLAPVQVIDELASEITGSELLKPGLDSRPR